MQFAAKSLQDAEGGDWDVRMDSSGASEHLTCTWKTHAQSGLLEPLFVACSDGEFVGGACVQVRTSFLKDAARGPLSSRAGAVLDRLYRKSFRSLSWEKGPSLATPEPSYEHFLRGFLDFIEVLARDGGIVAVGHATLPYYEKETVDLEGAHEVMARYGYAADERATVLLDMKGKGEDDIWGGLAKEARRKVRKAAKQGIEVIEGETEEDFEAYKRIRLETGRRNKIDYSRQVARWDGYRRTIPRGVSRIFLSKQGGDVLSGQTVTTVGSAVALGGVSYSDYSREHSLYGNDLVQWHIIKWSLEHGYTMIDWVGYELNATPKQKGINDFKIKWGGEIVPFRAYSKVFHPVRWHVSRLCSTGLSGLARLADRVT